MLRVPRVICDIAPPGLLRSEAEKATRLFNDHARSAAVLVTLPEDMPANETIELHAAITAEIGMSVDTLVLNAVLPKLFKSSERAALADLPGKLAEGSALTSLAHAGRARALREATQQGAIAKLREALPDIPRAVLPMLYVPEFRRAALSSLAEVFV